MIDHTRNVFLIIGTTGEYSDKHHWFVAAYKGPSAEKAAKAEAARLAGLVRDLEREAQTSDEIDDWDEHVVAGMVACGDPQCSHKYTGTTYTVEPVQLRRVD